MHDFSFSRRSSCSSYSLPRERASICRRKDRDKPRVKGRKREEKREDTGCHEMRCDTLGCSSLPGEPKHMITMSTNQQNWKIAIVKKFPCYKNRMYIKVHKKWVFSINKFCKGLSCAELLSASEFRIQKLWSTFEIIISMYKTPERNIWYI